MTPRQLEKIRARVKPLEEKEALKVGSGWLDREGRLYECTYATHRFLAEDIVNAADIKTTERCGHERELEKRGWVKISGIRPLFFSFIPREAGWLEYLKPSKEQMDFVMLFLSAHKQKEELNKWLERADRNDW